MKYLSNLLASLFLFLVWSSDAIGMENMPKNENSLPVISKELEHKCPIAHLAPVTQSFIFEHEQYLPENNNLSLFENYKNSIIQASSKEIKKNPRSRSAKLRVAVRSSEEFRDPIELRKKFKYLTDLEKRIA